MSGLNGVGRKQRRELRRRNHVARDLLTPKYGPRIRESNKHHLIDELHEQEADEEIYDYFDDKEMGLAGKE
jgi:hypothetical protein